MVEVCGLVFYFYGGEEGVKKDQNVAFNLVTTGKNCPGKRKNHFMLHQRSTARSQTGKKARTKVGTDDKKKRI